MPQYKLTYFNGKGRAEPVRLLLAHAKVDYVDDRIEGAQWPAIKASKTRRQSHFFSVNKSVTELTIFNLTSRYTLWSDAGAQRRRLCPQPVNGHSEIRRYQTRIWR